jgi:serine/threonine-protein kinase
VLPFESVGGDTANAYFAEGMADELSNALAKVPDLQLAGRSSARAFRGKQKSAQEIGAALNVGGVLEGTVRRAGGKVRVSTQLTNARTGLVLWNDSFERDAKDVFAVQDDIAQAIVRALQVTLAGGGAPAATAARGTTDLEAYDLYQRGMYFYQRRGAALVRAREYFEQATARDPQFARAYAGLGLTWLQLAAYSIVPYSESVPAAVAASERAVALDSLTADNWAALGLARFYQRQWRAADLATERAVRLDARSPVAQAVRARFLATVGRVDEAAAAAIASVTLDPGSVGYLNVAAQNLAIAGRFPEAIRFANRYWEIDSTLSTAGSAVHVLSEGGQVAEARRRAELVLRLSTDAGNSAMAIAVIAKSGDPAHAATVFAQQRARFAGRDGGGGLWTLAWFALGDTAQALTAMEENERRGLFGVVSPLGSRYYDPVRASPRFAALVRKVGLDVALFTSPNGGRPR